MKGTAKRRSLTVVWLCVALAMGIFVRLPAYHQRSWWIDELITAQVAGRPLTGPDLWDATRKPADSILGFTLQDTGPGPLVYLLDGVFSKFARPVGGEYWLRLPGLVAALLTIGMLYIFGRQWWGSRRLAATITLWAALFPPWVDFSMGARGYAWTVLFLLIQWHALWCLVSGSQTLDYRSRLSIVTLAVTTVLCFYLTPLNLVWCTPLWLTAAYFYWRNRQSFTPRLLRAVAVAALATAAAVVPYLMIWLMRLSAKGLGGGTITLHRAIARLHDFVDELSREPWYAVLAFVPLCLTALISILRLDRRPPVAMMTLTSWFTLVSGTMLSAALVLLFFLAPRYLVGFSIPLVWGSGIVFKQLLLFARHRWGQKFASYIILILTLLIATIETPSALHYARTPVHDWLSAVLWLNARKSTQDIIFCGPNADIEVLWAYAKQFHWDQQVPRWLIVENGRKVDTSTLEALQRALLSQRRLWYITPFFGQVRPPAYWAFVRKHFREVARFPGRGDIVILLHEPSDSH